MKKKMTQLPRVHVKLYPFAQFLLQPNRISRSQSLALQFDHFRIDLSEFLAKVNSEVRNEHTKSNCHTYSTQITLSCNIDC